MAPVGNELVRRMLLRNVSRAQPEEEKGGRGGEWGAGEAVGPQGQTAQEERGRALPLLRGGWVPGAEKEVPPVDPTRK